MRKITKEASKAFFDKRNFKKDNTQVIYEDGEVSLRLFGYTIAWTINGRIYFSMRGFDTMTTKERLRGLGLNIITYRGILYFGRVPIDSYSEYKTELCLNNRPPFLD